MEFWRLYRLVYARRWLIAAIMLIAAVVIFAGATLQAQKRIYQAQTYIRPTERALRDAIEAAPVASGAPGGGRISEFIMMLRNSNDIRLRTAELLSLPEDQRASKVQEILEENGVYSQQDALNRKRLTVLTKGKMAKAEIEKKIAESHKAAADQLARAVDARGPFAPTGLTAASAGELVEQIRTRLRFEPVPGTLSTEQNPSLANLIHVLATHEREAGARLFANMVCVAFIDYYTEQSRNSIETQRRDLEEKRDLAKSKYQAAWQELVNFQRQPGVLNVNPETSAVPENVARYEGDVNALQGQAAAAAAEVGIIQSLLNQEGALTQATLPSSEDPLVNKYEDQVAQARVAFQQISADKGENHPDYQRAERALKTLEQQLGSLKQRGYTRSSVNAVRALYRRLLGEARTRLQSAQAQLAVKRSQLSAERAKLAGLPQAVSKLAQLKGEVALHQKNADQLEEALNKFQIEAATRDKAGTIQMEPAIASPLGADRSAWVLMTYGVVLAMIFGIGLVVAMDALDNSIRSSTDVEQLLGLPICGVIPAQLPDPERAPRITYLDPLSPGAESYRLLRTDLLFTAEERPFKSLMLSTGKPGQGATTTVCNLAIALAQAGKRVILVDADLRRPKLHNIFKVKNDVGLTSLLNDECEIEEALKATEMDNLLLLPSGPLPLNPSELLASNKMRALHEQLKPHTDFILFDTPSAIAFSDATVLSSFLDAVLMVIRANNVPRGSEQQVKAMLNKAKANIIGVVLNGMNPEHVDSVHYHYHYYPVLATKGALNGTNGTNGHGHHSGSGVEIPLALPDGSTAEPVAAPVSGAVASEGGSAIAPALSTAVGEKTQAFTAPVHKAVNMPEPFLQEHRRSLWKRVRAAVPFLLLAVGIALLVLLLNNMVSPVAPTRP